MDKHHLRLHMRKQRRGLTPPQRKHLGEQYLRQILTLSHYRRAKHIACYWPLWGELDTRPLMNHAIAAGKTVFLPVIDGTRMWFSPWRDHDLRSDRRTGLIQAQKSNQRLLPANRLDLVVVPLVAFNRNGMRIGQGGGFYDRFFARQHHQKWCKPKLFGAAYDFQEYPQIPCDDWDVPLAGIVTNSEVIISNQQRRSGT